MKRVIALFLTVVTVAAFAVPAMADTVTSLDPVSKDITATYQTGTPATEVISVDITWDDTGLVYTGESKGTWNPATHSYDGTVAASWTDKTCVVKISNHSNVALEADLTYTQASGSNVTATFDKSTFTMVAADTIAKKDDVPVNTATLSVTGGSITESGTVGSISIELSKSTT